MKWLLFTLVHRDQTCNQVDFGHGLLIVEQSVVPVTNRNRISEEGEKLQKGARELLSRPQCSAALSSDRCT